MTAPRPAPVAPARGLRRQLGSLQTVSISVGVMAPTLAVSITGVQPARLIGRAAPRAQGVTATVFQLPPGTSLGTVALASTFGFLSFAGFESAGSVGEEAHRPLRRVPSSMLVAIAVGGVFYVACIAVQAMAFGTDAAGVRAFAAADAPLGDLAHSYIGRGMTDALDVAAIVSALGAGLGCASVSARMLYAFGRDGVFDSRLGEVSPGTGAPAGALAIVMLFDLALLLGFAIGGAE